MVARSVTLREVAQAAGVSVATASKVANGITQGMSEATFERVQSVARDLNYRPNRNGRELRTQRNQIVGMMVVDDSPAFLTDPYITYLVAGLSNYLGSRGYGLLLHGIHPAKFGESFLIRESVAVALCAFLSGARKSRVGYLRTLESVGLPLLVFQEERLEPMADCCFLNQDDEGGARRLAEKIALRKPGRVMILVPALAWHGIEARVRGYRQVFDDHGIKYRIIRCDEDRVESVAVALRGAIKSAGLPDIVVGANDRLAHAAYKHLLESGVHVPEDVGITGFNAFPQGFSVGPVLESVQSPAYELGQLGAQALLRRLDSACFESPELSLPVSAVEGDTLAKIGTVSE